MTDHLKAFIEQGAYLKACETHPSERTIEHIAAYDYIKSLEAFRDEVMSLPRLHVEVTRTKHEGNTFAGWREAAPALLWEDIQSIHAKHFPKEQSGHE